MHSPYRLHLFRTLQKTQPYFEEHLLDIDETFAQLISIEISDRAVEDPVAAWTLFSAHGMHFEAEHAHYVRRSVRVNISHLVEHGFFDRPATPRQTADSDNYLVAMVLVMLAHSAPQEVNDPAKRIQLINTIAERYFNIKLDCKEGDDALITTCTGLFGSAWTTLMAADIRGVKDIGELVGVYRPAFTFDREFLPSVSESGKLPASPLGAMELA